MILTARPRNVSVSTKCVTADLDNSNGGTLSLTITGEGDSPQPSVFARQHITNLLRDKLWRTGAKKEFILTRYFTSKLPLNTRRTESR